MLWWQASFWGAGAFGEQVSQGHAVLSFSHLPSSVEEAACTLGTEVIQVAVLGFLGIWRRNPRPLFFLCLVFVL